MCGDNEQAPGEYLATLPALVCGADVNYYLSAESADGAFTDPPGAPAQSHSLIVVTDEHYVSFATQTEWQGVTLNVPYRHSTDLVDWGVPGDALPVLDMKDELSYVTDAVSLIRQELKGAVPLIGFSGSPWTLATYMIEGSGSKDFRHAKSLMFSQPELMHRLLGKLADTVTDYLNAQIAAGAQAVQIFDTWGGALSRSLQTSPSHPVTRPERQSVGCSTRPNRLATATALSDLHDEVLQVARSDAGDPARLSDCRRPHPAELLPRLHG